MLGLNPVPSNMYLSIIVDEYKTMAKRDSCILERANLDALALIKLYDENKDIRFLNTAYDIICWLKNECAEMLGYNDQYHFIRQFKSFTGISPGKYRKSNR